MAKHRPGKKGIARLLKTALILVAIVVVGLVGWHYLAPVVMADSVTLYDSYTVETGNIETTLSFSATLDVKYTTTYTSSEMSRVKELYVESGDEVAEGDSLVLLSNGELLTAGFDGVVNELRVSVGDWVRPNFSLLQLCDLVNLSVTMEVDEYDVKTLTVGQACTVSVISLGIDYETTIGHINRVSASSGTLAYYTVTCDLSVPPEVLPGMRATVTIPSQSAEDVTVLPLTALAFDDDDNAYTLVMSADGSYEKQFVETGISDGMQVEIITGVNVGDTVYAVSGTQSANVGFSLEDIYRAFAGERVVINETSTQMTGTMQMSEDFTLPTDMTTDGTSDTALPSDSNDGETTAADTADETEVTDTAGETTESQSTSDADADQADGAAEDQLPSGMSADDAFGGSPPDGTFDGQTPPEGGFDGTGDMPSEDMTQSDDNTSENNP